MNETLGGVVSKVFCVCLFIFLLTGCGGYKSTKAVDECKDLVLDKLRAPASAIFSEIQIKDLDGKSYEIVGSFDAQNGFGAMLRGSFRCMGYEKESVRLINVG